MKTMNQRHDRHTEITPFVAISFHFLLPILLLVMLQFPAISFAQSFRGIGFIPDSDDTWIDDLDIEGGVAVGSVETTLGGNAFYWSSATGIRALPSGNLSDGRSGAVGVADDGRVIAGYYVKPNDAPNATRWTSANDYADPPLPSSGTSSVAYAVSGDGAVMVGEVDRQAARWTQASGWVGLGALPGHTLSLAVAVNRNGSVVVGTSGNSEAFRWTSAGMVGLGVLPGMTRSSALDVSPDGKIVVGWSWDDGDGRQAFLWTAATGMRALPFGEARRVNACGNVAVGVDGDRAVRWTLSGVEDIRQALIDAGESLDTWKLFIATGLSGDGGTIAGNGVDPNGLRQGWIATLPPPPPLPKAGKMCKLKRWKSVDTFPGPFTSEQDCKRVFRALRKSCAKS